MTETHNPYAAALDGLELADPVAGFFSFCRERELIRLRRERGEPAPWSDDAIFQRARFLNVFREDDRGSKAIMRFVAPRHRQDTGQPRAEPAQPWKSRSSLTS